MGVALAGVIVASARGVRQTGGGAATTRAAVTALARDR